VESRSRVDLPSYVTTPYEVYVNGIPQTEGVDYDVFGPSLVFRRRLAREGKLSWWRWASMLLGIAGTYRKHETVSIVYTLNGRNAVAELAPADEEA
jgi:hypothetical protein